MRHSGSTLRASRARIPWYPGDGSARADSSPFSILPSGEENPGCKRPTVLLSPVHGGPGKTPGHRTYQTIEGLGGRLGITIDSAFAVGQESQLAASVVSDYSGVVLICWEHHHIPAIASALPLRRETAIPQAWPKHRYNVVWTFTLVPDAATPQYAFGQIPQLLLSGDSDTVIPA